MNNQQATPQKITLEYIARLKTEKLEEIRGHNEYLPLLLPPPLKQTQ